ncbi:excalibur calcium-binding domain-containing protein [Rhodoferax sp. WC2427]|uniref:excalibur calcium-binding domain-containing protein n=1 Tax=Rhodoferax sp. WC2427 TaxID=3234144 RepID=UPI00346649C5
MPPGIRSTDAAQWWSRPPCTPEAKYFLANYPGVRMDGNHDGVPCEMQWCTR